MAFFKRESFDNYDKQLRKIEQEELEYKHRMQCLNEEKQTVLKKRRDYGIQRFADSEKRRQIIKEAEETHYSQSDIEKLKEYDKLKWNQDNITNEIIDEYNDATLYVKDRKAYRNNPLYILSAILGGEENEN